MRHQQGSGDNKAIDQQQHALPCRFKHGADQRRDLETAELGQYGQRIVMSPVVAGQCHRQQVALARHAGIVEPGTAPHHIDQRAPGQAMREQ